MVKLNSMGGDWQWENATAGAFAGLATVAFSHPLDVVRTRFQVSDGRTSTLPAYKNTPQALWSIARTEGFRGIYAGFHPAVLGSTISWGLYFFFYSKAKQRYSKSHGKLTPGLHLASAAEAGALVSLCTNPLWLIKTRLQLQTPLHQTRPYAGLIDAVRTILKEEGLGALYKGLGPSLFLVTHGAIQFTAYEELRKAVINHRSKDIEEEFSAVELLGTLDHATLGASSKLTAILMTYPFQVIRSRLQQRPSVDGNPIYKHSWHVVRETARFEGLRGFYRGITANLLKNVPAASITFIVFVTPVSTQEGDGFNVPNHLSFCIRRICLHGSEYFTLRLAIKKNQGLRSFGMLPVKIMSWRQHIPCGCSRASLTV